MNTPSPFPLFSARLKLRRFQPEDAPALSAYRSQPEVACYQSWESFTEAEATQFIQEQSSSDLDSPGKWLQLAVVEIASGQIAGDCGLLCRAEDPRQTELGITFAPGFQRRGYAREAVECVVRYLFDVLNKHRIMAVVDVENTAAATLFQRAGFRQEAHFREHVWFKGRWSSEFVFAMLRSDWRQSQVE